MFWRGLASDIKLKIERNVGSLGILLNLKGQNSLVIIWKSIHPPIRSLYLLQLRGKQTISHIN